MRRQAAPERARGGEDEQRLGDGDRALDGQPRQHAAERERPGQRMRGDVDRDADGERAQRAAERAPQQKGVDRQLAEERQGERGGPGHDCMIAERAC